MLSQEKPADNLHFLTAFSRLRIFNSPLHHPGTMTRRVSGAVQEGLHAFDFDSLGQVLVEAR
jgi:hypothetical protein